MSRRFPCETDASHDYRHSSRPWFGLGLALPAAATQSAAHAKAEGAAHARAKAQVEARDKRHHNKLKTEGIPAVAGAVAGAVVAGPAGAFAGAKTGHSVGTGFHMIKKHHDIKQQEKRNAIAHRRYVSHRRTTSTASAPSHLCSNCTHFITPRN